MLDFLLTGHDFTNPTQERTAPVAPPAPLCGWASAPLPALAPAFSRAVSLAPPSAALLNLVKLATWGPSWAWVSRVRGGGVTPPRDPGPPWFSHPLHSPQLSSSGPFCPTPKQGWTLGRTLEELAAYKM